MGRRPREPMGHWASLESDSSILDPEITLNPEIIANIKPAPERVVHRYKEHLRHPDHR